MSYASGVCAPWVAEGDVCSDEVTDGALRQQVATAATELLFVLSGSRFTGACTVTVRPTLDSMPCAGEVSEVLNMPTQSGAYPGRWSDPAYVVDLGYYPVKSITSVVIDGSALDASAYRVDDQRWLVRQDGQPWPYAQLRQQPLSEQLTWAVTAVVGDDPPEAGKLAAQVLACELGKSLTPGCSTCRLPKRIQSITRQGVSMVLIDPFEFLSAGKTGLYEVDIFLAAFPQGGSVVATAHDLGRARAVQQTYP